MLIVARCMVSVVCRLSCVLCRSVDAVVVFSLSFDVCCLLIVVCCWLSGVACLLFIVCCLRRCEE